MSSKNYRIGKSNRNNMGDSYRMDIVGSTAVRRIRTPHSHDVLSGRGGGINSHDGNRTFREWVRQRKNKYNLAGSKAEKAQVAKEVINLVKSLKPPGRFLQRENPSVPGVAGWWVELDEIKAMAKTSQALREGAPQIRAAHKDEIEENHRKSRSGRKGKKRPAASSLATGVTSAVTPSISGFHGKNTAVPQNPLPLVSRNTFEAPRPEKIRNTLEAPRPEKRYRVDISTSQVEPPKDFNFEASTPPLVPLALPADIPTIPALTQDVPEVPNVPKVPDLPKRNSIGGLKRINSLALSDISNGDLALIDYEFVNPFAYESDCEEGQMSMPEKMIKGSQRNRSLSSQGTSCLDLSDLPTTSAPQDTEFGEGMKVVYEVAHPGLSSPINDDTIPTHLYQYQGGNVLSRPHFSLVRM